mgnify:CR=1 FL=1
MRNILLTISYDGTDFCGWQRQDHQNKKEAVRTVQCELESALEKLHRQPVILYGSDVLSKNRYDDCFGKALRVRRVVAEKFEALMKEYDAVLTPVCNKEAYETYDIKDAFMKVFDESVFTALANLIGTPALVSNGVQLMGKHFSEGTLLSLAGSVERAGE